MTNGSQITETSYFAHPTMKTHRGFRFWYYVGCTIFTCLEVGVICVINLA